jgi:hypothetical protein
MMTDRNARGGPSSLREKARTFDLCMGAEKNELVQLVQHLRATRSGCAWRRSRSGWCAEFGARGMRISLARILK